MWAVRGPRLSHQLRCLRHHAGGIRARIPPAFSSPLHCVIVPQQKFSRFIRTTRKGMLVMDGNALWRDSLAIAVETVRAVRAVTAVVHCKTSEFNAHSAKKNNLLSAANGYKYNVSEPFLLHWFAAGRSSSSRYPVHLAVRSVHSAIFWNRINEKLCSFFCFFFFFSFDSVLFIFRKLCHFSPLSRSYRWLPCSHSIFPLNILRNKTDSHKCSCTHRDLIHTNNKIFC